MTANDLSADELAEALLRGTSGMYTAEAAIRLLPARWGSGTTLLR